MSIQDTIDKAMKMIQSTDPEMQSLGLSIMIDHMRTKDDFSYIKDYIRKIPKNMGANRASRGKRADSVRKRLKVAAQKKYMEVLLKTKK